MGKPATYLTTAEVIDRLAANGLSVSDETVQRWARTGRLPSYRRAIGRTKYLFDPKDVDALLEITKAGAA